MIPPQLRPFLTILALLFGSLPAVHAAPLLQSLPASATGLDFTNRLAAERGMTNQVLYNGSGVAAGDVDGDGLADLVFGNLGGPPQMFRNLGAFKFTNVTVGCGLKDAVSDSTGVCLVDVDGDGDLDLIFNTYGRGTYLYLNDGHGIFSLPAGFHPMNGSDGGMSPALADIDGDGDLDLFIPNYRTVTIRDQPNTKFSFRNVNGKPELATINGKPLTDPEYTNRFIYSVTASGGKGNFNNIETGLPYRLYLNDGKGGFTEDSIASGRFRDETGAPIKFPLYDWGQGAAFRDINGDGYPDLYVCNDFQTADRIWMNDGKGNFRAAPAEALRHIPYSSMGVDFGDLDRDGFDDFAVVEMLSPHHESRMLQHSDVRGDLYSPGFTDDRPQYSQNAVYHNRGDGTYAEIAEFSGMAATDWSWVVALMDVDLDGYEDFLITTGFERDNTHKDALKQFQDAKARRQLSSAEQFAMRTVFPRLATPNHAYRNLRGNKFAEVGHEWGFDAATVSQGMCLVDLDNDGDLDVVVNNMNEAALVYRNECKAPRVLVRLAGRTPNGEGIGARVIARAKGLPVQAQEIQSGGRYLSSDAPERMFAAGTNAEVEIEVQWRAGGRSLVKAAANAVVVVREDESKPWTRTVPDAHKPNFVEDAPKGWSSRPVELEDLDKQALLPQSLAEMGPGVGWVDLDGNGTDELVVAGQRGGYAGVFARNDQGWFGLWTNAPAMVRNQTTPLMIPGMGLMVGMANYVDGIAVGPAVRNYQVQAGGVVKTDDEAMAYQEGWGSTGAMAAADVDGDGDVDLWVGGRATSSRWPESTSSHLFRNDAGKWVLDAKQSEIWKDSGMVVGATFADLNGDGRPDLITASEWGTVRIWFNEGAGQWREMTAPLGLDKYRGLWSGVAVGDLDGDGRPDLVVGNAGGNTRYELGRHEGPIRLYSGDWDGEGSVEVIEGWRRGNKWLPFRSKDVLEKSLPWLNEKFPSHQAYAEASVEEIMGADLLAKSKISEANWLETTIFWNRGDHFEAQALPDEAQWSSVYGVAVVDFDGDGKEDIVLSENFFDLATKTPRLDAGTGLCLRNLGGGHFEPLKPGQSGVRVWGQGRGLAVGDYDGDGRPDLVFAQVGGGPKVYRNQSARPGLRVRLKGSGQNPSAIGARLRLIGGGSSHGVWHEIRSGGGYWSSDSLMPVLAWPEELGNEAVLEVMPPWSTVVQKFKVSAAPGTTMQVQLGP